MAAKSPRPGTAKDRALDHVKAQILTGEFAGGELISEGDVATALGIQPQQPLGLEAQERLAHRGARHPQRGALVVPVSPGEVRAVMEARLVLEQFAAAKVVGRGPAVWAVVFERQSGELRRQGAAAAAADWREFLESDRAFHAITLEESGNAILSNFYSTLRDRQMRMIGESALREPDRVATIMAEHRGIAEALRDGDLPRALRAVQTHLASTVRAMGLSVEPNPLWATGSGAHGAD